MGDGRVIDPQEKREARFKRLWFCVGFVCGFAAVQAIVLLIWALQL